MSQANGILRLSQDQIAADGGAAKTALQMSAERGDAATTEALVDLMGAPPPVDQLRDQDGLSPIDKLQITHPRTVAPGNIAKILRADQAAAGSSLAE